MSEENEKFTPAAGDAVLVNHEGKPAGARVEAVEQSGKVDARITDYGHPKHGMVVKFAPEDVAPLPADYVPPEPPKPKPSVSPMANTGRRPDSVQGRRVESMREMLDSPDEITYCKTDHGWLLSLPGIGPAGTRNHGLQEHDDGTITLSPSFLATNGDVRRHGYFQGGWWNPCNDDQPPAPKQEQEADESYPPAPDSEEFKEAVLDLHAKLPKYAEDVKNFVKVYVDEKTAELEKRIAALEEAAAAADQDQTT